MSMIRELIMDANNLFENGKFDSISLFTGEMDIAICVDDGATVEYAERCIRHYNQLVNNKAVMAEIQEMLGHFFIYMYHEWEEMDIYENIFQALSLVLATYERKESLLPYLSRPRMYVFQSPNDEIGYSIECDCPWEPEHQCQIIIRSDNVLYVGPSEGNTPWDNEDEYYCIWDN